MRYRVYTGLALSMLFGSALASQPGCYRTAEAAAAQVGVRGVDGFWLEGRRRDAFSGAIWATVRSCEHPERPGLLFLSGGDLPGYVTSSRNEVASALLLLAGVKVTLLQRDDVTQIEMQGIAQGSGALGDRVKVRLLALSPEGTERFVDAIVRGSNSVEVVAR